MGNVTRDRKNRRFLRRTGWTPIVIWECETRNAERLTKKLETKIDTVRAQ